MKLGKAALGTVIFSIVTGGIISDICVYGADMQKSEVPAAKREVESNNLQSLEEISVSPKDGGTEYDEIPEDNEITGSDADPGQEE